jgi:hypothetical protein
MNAALVACWVCSGTLASDEPLGLAEVPGAAPGGPRMREAIVCLGRVARSRDRCSGAGLAYRGAIGTSPSRLDVSGALSGSLRGAATAHGP